MWPSVLRTCSATFFDKGWENASSHHLVAWDKFYMPKCKGDVGLRKLKLLNKALLYKKALALWGGMEEYVLKSGACQIWF